MNKTNPNPLPAEATKNSRPKHKAAIKMTATSRVGIFWIFRGKLLATVCPLGDGESYGDAINGPINHVTQWQVFQKLNPELRSLEYQSVPRGRVLFMKPTGEFHVYLDRVLDTQRNRKALLQAFELPKSSTRFLRDAHYTTDLEDLERLFS
jgi:hypothetical protein